VFLDRYNSGDHTGVWDELPAIEDVDALDASVRQDVEAVVAKTVNRAAKNLRTISLRLAEKGYAFFNPDWGMLANAAAPEILRSLIDGVGDVPPVVSAWLTDAGLVSLRGRTASASTAGSSKHILLDPFEFLISIDDLQERLVEYNRIDGPFALEFAADTYTKNDVSGGDASYILLPSKTVDALVYEDAAQNPDGEDGIWFVDYLREYFRGAGFRKTRISSAKALDSIPIAVDGLLSI
jgi:hypothetical protein